MSVEDLKIEGDVKGLVELLKIRYVDGKVPESFEADSRVREEAARALGEIGNPGAVDALIDTLEKDFMDNVCQAVAVALGQIGDLRAIEPLVAVIRKPPNPPVGITVAQALAKFGAPAVPPLIAALESEASRADETKIGSPLYDSVDRRWKNKKAYITDALVEIGIPAMQPLANVLNDEQKGWKFRSAVVDILKIINAPGVVEILISALKGDISWYVAGALGQIGDIKAVEPLVAILSDAEPGYERESAAKALGKFDNPRAVAALRTVLEDKNLDVRKAATQSLEEINQRNIDIPDKNLTATDAELKDKIESGKPMVTPEMQAVIDAAIREVRQRMKSCPSGNRDDVKKMSEQQLGFFKPANWIEGSEDEMISLLQECLIEDSLSGQFQLTIKEFGIVGALQVHIHYTQQTASGETGYFHVIGKAGEQDFLLLLHDGPVRDKRLAAEK
ncbi:MAG: HEAT repeat domain-containing protein [Anaerolineales bacterium]|nr:HEAT repeat domain-containing protein [Anaerolineales bacterium]